MVKLYHPTNGVTAFHVPSPSLFLQVLSYGHTVSYYGWCDSFPSAVPIICSTYVCMYDINTYLEYRHLIKGTTNHIWETLFVNEIGQIYQGIGIRMSQGNNTILFIPKVKVMAWRTVTYGLMLTELLPQKSKTCITLLNVRGNIIDFPSDITNPTVYITTDKILFYQYQIKYSCVPTYPISTWTIPWILMSI